MGARVTLELKAGRKMLCVTALLNGGFESEEPCVLLPRAAALALYRRIPANAAREGIQTAGGASNVIVLPSPLKARVLVPSRKGPSARLSVLISSEETEVLASDTAIDALGVEILSHGKGIWRFSHERVRRESVPRAEWPRE